MLDDLMVRFAAREDWDTCEPVDSRYVAEVRLTKALAAVADVVASGDMTEDALLAAWRKAQAEVAGLMGHL